VTEEQKAIRELHRLVASLDRRVTRLQLEVRHEQEKSAARWEEMASRVLGVGVKSGGGCRVTEEQRVEIEELVRRAVGEFLARMVPLVEEALTPLSEAVAALEHRVADLEEKPEREAGSRARQDAIIQMLADRFGRRVEGAE
jgi:phage shock protein A